MFAKLAWLQLSLLLALTAYAEPECRNETTVPNSQILKDTMNAFVVGGVVPDLLPRFNPVATMRVSFQPDTVFSTVFFPGQRVPQGLTKKEPKIQIRLPPDQSPTIYSSAGSAVSLKSTYTFIMIDPDVPSRINNTLGPFRHMLATQVKLIYNHPYFDLQFTIKPITPYEGPSPPEGTGFHRYAFLLYPGQPSKEVLNRFNATYPSRFNFNLLRFTTEAGLCDPIAGTFMFTENSLDESKNLVH